MTSLFLFTVPAPLLISLAIDEGHSSGGDILCVSFDDNTYGVLKQAQLSPMPLRATDHSNWKQRDIAFKEVAMPGSLDFNIPGTELPVWQVISLDRLNFFYRGNALKEWQLLISLKWDKAFVPLDLHHPLTWKIGRKFSPTIGVQAGPVRTREMLDVLNAGIQFSDMLVEDKPSQDFVNKHGYNARVYEK